MILAVHHEAARIRARLGELVELIELTGLPAELIVVADGCTDGTVTLAQSHPSSLVRVLELTENEGKAQALSHGCAAATGDILVFADARQRWAVDSLQRLLANFTCPEVGAVSGELLLDAPPGVLAGVGLYWRYERWLRRNEGRLHSTVGVSGSICAVRRELFRPIPQGVLLDDLYWPLQVVLQGWRVVYDERALAYDRLPDRTADEFRRKVRRCAATSSSRPFCRRHYCRGATRSGCSSCPTSCCVSPFPGFSWRCSWRAPSSMNRSTARRSWLSYSSTDWRSSG